MLLTSFYFKENFQHEEQHSHINVSILNFQRGHEELGSEDIKKRANGLKS